VAIDGSYGEEKKNYPSDPTYFVFVFGRRGHLLRG